MPRQSGSCAICAKAIGFTVLWNVIWKRTWQDITMISKYKEENIITCLRKAMNSCTFSNKFYWLMVPNILPIINILETMSTGVVQNIVQRKTTWIWCLNISCTKLDMITWSKEAHSSGHLQVMCARNDIFFYTVVLIDASNITLFIFI